MLTASRGGAEMVLTYDKAGRKLTMDDPDMGDWSYVYNALGGMTNQTDARGCITNIAYDELNRPTGKTYSSCPTTSAVTYTYDAGANGKGRRTSMSVSGADFTSWTYDARGRVVSENKQITGGGQFVTSFAYNDADLPITMTYPDGEAVNFEYNANMLPVSVDGLSPYAQSIAYDSANRMIQLIRGANKINTVFTYNPWNADGGRLQNLTSTQVSTGTQLQNSTYDYDSVGNIETIVDSLSGPQTQTLRQAQGIAFTYDALDRLTNSSVTGGTNGLYTEGYAYNASTGNLSSKNSATYTYSTTHKHAAASLSNGNTYGYDDNGNMTSRHVFETTSFKDYTLTYNAENQLVSVSGDATANFVYDGDGKQIKATVNGITAVYVGNHYEVKNSVVTKYYFAGATRLAVRTDGTLRFLLGDHLGSSSVTTNASGAKTASAMYKAFGETRFTSGTLSTDYKFTGQREESALGGIYFFQSRWFDPTLGRFMSPDTIVPTSTQGTQAWDRYAFVNNNPVRYTDPTGHCLFVCTILAGAAIGAVVSMATQGVMIATGRQESMNWGTVAGAAAAGAFFGGAVFLAPAGLGLVGTGVVGALAGATSGQVGIATEAVVNEYISDGAEYSPSDALASAAENGLGDPGQMALDAAGGAAALYGGQAMTKAAQNIGLLPKPNIAKGVPMIKPGYKPFSGGQIDWRVEQRVVEGLNVNPTALTSTTAYILIQVMEETIQQTVGGLSSE